MDKHEVILKKIESIDESIKNIDVTLAKQEEQITHHIKRTDLLEKLIFMTLAGLGALGLALLHK